MKTKEVLDDGERWTKNH